MNEKEREILYKLLIDLFLDSPDRTPAQTKQKGTTRNESNKANARRTIHKPNRKDVTH